MSEYLIEQGLDKDIVRIEGLNEFITELRRIGNNINQLTHFANSGEISAVYLDEFKEDLKKIWSRLGNIYI